MRVRNSRYVSLSEMPSRMMRQNYSTLGTLCYMQFSNLFNHCRWGSFACHHQVLFHFIIILAWRFSVSFSLEACTSNRMTGWLMTQVTHPLMWILHKVSLSFKVILSTVFPIQCIICMFLKMTSPVWITTTSFQMSKVFRVNFVCLFAVE